MAFQVHTGKSGLKSLESQDGFMQNVTSRKGSGATTLFILTALVCVPAVAATYHLDSSGGDDRNDGLTPETAWQTLPRVGEVSLGPGDTILFKRGGIWNGQFLLATSGKAGNPITLGAYGTGESPIFTGAVPVFGWTVEDSNRYSAVVTSRPAMVVFDGVRGMEQASIQDVDGDFEWYWSDDTLTVYASGVVKEIDAVLSRFVLGVTGASHVVFRDLTVRYALDPVYLSEANDVLLDGLTVYDNMGAAAISISSETEGAGERNTVQNCSLYNTSRSSASSEEDFDGCGILLLGEHCRNNLVSKNVVYGSGHEGIVVFGGSNNTITGNFVSRSARSGIRVAQSSAGGNRIEGNLVYENTQQVDDRFGIDLIMVGNGNIVRYNIVHDQHDTYNDPSIPAASTNQGRKYGSGGIRFDGADYWGNLLTESTGNKAYYNLIYNEYCGIQSFNFCNVEISNNTVVDSDMFGVLVVAVGGVQTRDNVVRNNIVYTANRFLMYHYAGINTVFDHNTYYPDGPTSFVWQTGEDVYNMSDFALWRTRSGQDINSRLADPRFMSVEAVDFRLKAESPCIDRGADLGYTRDLAEAPVPMGKAADIGAFEYESAGEGEGEGEPVEAGSLVCLVSPVEAAIAGARWRVDGGGWHKSGEGVDNLAVGEHIVRFSFLRLWRKPPDQKVIIIANETYRSTAVYTKLPDGISCFGSSLPYPPERHASGDLLIFVCSAGLLALLRRARSRTKTARQRKGFAEWH